MTGPLRLHALERGAGPPVVLLHGFTGHGGSLAAMAEALASDHRSFCVDLIGHGASPAPRDANAYSMAACVAQLDAWCDTAGLQDAHVVGYSMGGRVALAFAVQHPERVRSLALIGARAGFADPQERAARVRADDALAERIEREGVPAFVEHWISLPLFASQRRRIGEAAWESARQQRLANAPHALAASLRGMGSGAQSPLHAALGTLRCPTLLIAGVEDTRFIGIARDLARRLPDARLWLAPEAGHAAHIENPGATHRALRDFLAAQAAAPHAPRSTSQETTSRNVEERP